MQKIGVPEETMGIEPILKTIIQENFPKIKIHIENTY